MKIKFSGEYHMHIPGLLVGGMPSYADGGRDAHSVDMLYLFSYEWTPVSMLIHTSDPVVSKWVPFDVDGSNPASVSMCKWVPFDDDESKPVSIAMHRILDVLDKTLDIMSSGGTVAYSCLGGKNRSAMMAALFTKAMGIEDSVGLMRRARPGCLTNQRFADFVNKFEYRFGGQPLQTIKKARERRLCAEEKVATFKTLVSIRERDLDEAKELLASSEKELADIVSLATTRRR